MASMSKGFEKRFTGKARAAIENYASITKGAKGIALAIKELVHHYVPDDARDVLICINATMAAKRKALGIATSKREKSADEITASRVSEIAGLLRLRAWSCHNQLLDMLNDLEAPKDTIIFVSKRVREMDKTVACPPRAQVIKWINLRKSGRNADGKGKAKKKINPVIAVKSIREHLNKLANTYGKSEGASFIVAMLKACKSYEPYATAIVEANKPEPKPKVTKKAKTKK